MYRFSLCVCVCALLGEAFASAALIENVACETVISRALDVAESEEVCKEAVVKAGAANNKKHTVTSLINLGLLYERRGRFADAKRNFEQAAEAAGNEPGSESGLLRASALVALSRAANALGDWSLAQKSANQSLVLREMHLPTNSVPVANSLSQLGVALLNQNRNQDALNALERAFEIGSASVESPDFDIGVVLSNLGSAYLALKDNRAEQTLKHAVSALEKAHGSGSVNVAPPLNQLGELYFSQKKYALAEKHLKRSLVVREKAYGKNHLSLVVGLNSLASLYGVSNRCSKANPLLTRASVIAKAHFAEDHPTVRTIRENMAFCKM
jgi:tetratricopeptide (TPR) repeat protein